MSLRLARTPRRDSVSKQQQQKNTLRNQQYLCNTWSDEGIVFRQKCLKTHKHIGMPYALMSIQSITLTTNLQNKWQVQPVHATVVPQRRVLTPRGMQICGENHVE